MAMKKLAPDIQSLFCASTQITTYKTAIEELVYNSLDAEATSIAIRVNIDENCIQVFDNGTGVGKHNFKLLGQRYATSKCVDISTLKSVPNKYGSRGQSLASIKEVSKRLTITSKCANTEETWTKEFFKSKEYRLAEATVRPSKGTTVEIKGFLYNLHIQKKSTDSLTELNDIKTFLQKLSLVHDNISLSLRDDSKNEIIFKLQKNRDIYQTLSTVFEVEKKDLQELKVEKNEYKVTAFIANRDRDISQYHWVYLNGKFVNDSKIYKVIDEYLIKLLGLKNTRKKTKLKNNLFEPENLTSKKTIPLYFIFITCPYYVYDISYKSNRSSLEFKDWENIKKLMEKLAKFYVGDVQLKEIVATKTIENKADNKEDETREQVKKIMERILRNNPKRPRVSQMKNGVKGKIIKRKLKKKTAKFPLVQILQPQQSQENIVLNNVINHGNISGVMAKNDHVSIKKETIFNKSYNKPMKKDMKHKSLKPIINKDKKNAFIEKEAKSDKINKPMKKDIKHINNVNNVTKNPKTIKNKEQKKDLQSCKGTRPDKSNIQKQKQKVMYIAKKKQNKLKDKIKQKLINANKKLQIRKKLLKDEKSKPLVDPILNKFKSDSVKHRCNDLANKVDNLMNHQNKRKHKIVVNETVHYSTFVKNYKNLSVRRKVDKIVIQDFIPLPQRFDQFSIDNRVWIKLPEKSCKTSYDLIQNILKSQQKYNSSNKNKIYAELSQIHTSKQIKTCDDQENEIDDVEKYSVPYPNCYETLSEVHKFTYDSHNHYRSKNSSHHRYYNRPAYDFLRTNDHYEFTKTKNETSNFITKQLRDNFVVPESQQFSTKFENGVKKYFLSKREPHKWQKSFFTNYEYNNGSWPQENSFTIDFTKSNDCKNVCDMEEKSTDLNNPQCEKYGILQSNSVCGGTYTIISNTSQTSLGVGDYQYYQSNHMSLTQKTYRIQTSNEHVINSNEGNVNFVYCNKENEELVVKDNETVGNDKNILVLSKSQNNLSNCSDVEPINICETTMQSNQNMRENDNFSKSFFNDSLFNYDFSIDSVLFDRDTYTHLEHIIDDQQADFNKERYSQYFEENKNNLKREKNILRETDQVHDVYNTNYGEKSRKNKHFNLKRRPRFVPKGLSPIFVNCQTAKVCDYNFEKDYFEDTIYNHFANEVQVQSEIFEPNIQHVKELRTKDIARVNERLDKDNASLVFNAESLDQAIVLRQVDSKFIAVKIKGKSYQSADISEHLVLFDQHAVHERIRLEKNLADYLIGDEWKSVALDEITLKLTKEELIYMHNYKDKFSQFGLQWVVLSNEEIKITGIPEAILGKNPRQVDVVMRAVRNLISEQIQAMKTQKGCVSLYPKSIMDLVFSEACRYAIKFGDKLSTHECMELLKSLSKCKTPFQCAHGRPVMAILMSIEPDPNIRQYQIVTSKLHRFVASLK